MFSWAAPLALFGATTFGLSQTITRELRGIHWAPLVLWQLVGGGLIGAATVPWAWTTPTLFDLGLMFLVGAVAMLCFIFIVKALSLARAAVLAPLQYSAILWAAILGWLVWRDAPTVPILIGNAIIIGSGLYVAARGKMVGEAVE
jgi:S-adenosylmethionine uptake transporter